jgi:Protein of unknown function (DUF1761)
MLMPIAAATIAAFVFGAVYYGVLGKRWAAALGKPYVGGVVPVVPMIVSVVCEAIMAAVFAIVLRHVAGEGATILDGMATGALLWFGFVATMLVTNHAYAGAKRALTLIDGGHWLGVLLIQGAVLAALS